ncbi:MAG: nuclear transport factor 2 family protein [Gaiellaceae bacterium]
MTDHAQLVSAYIEAVGDGRVAEVAGHLRPDVTFSGPGMPLLRGVDAYVAALERLRPIIARNEIRSVLVDGDEACVLYDFVTDTPAGAVVSAEWLTIEDGRIGSVYLLFDKARWPEVLQQLELSAASA